jgi:hypothetical protein
MNRSIESTDRITNRSLHYPMRSDVFGSEAVFQASDYLIVLHRPVILGIPYYGINNIPTDDIIFLHCLKNRDGETGVIYFKDNLKYNRMDETSLEEIFSQLDDTLDDVKLNFN